MISTSNTNIINTNPVTNGIPTGCSITHNNSRVEELEERLSNIEKVLGIPKADGVMFVKYPSLKKKYDAYINELTKLRTWDALKE